MWCMVHSNIVISGHGDDNLRFCIYITDQWPNALSREIHCRRMPWWGRYFDSSMTFINTMNSHRQRVSRRLWRITCWSIKFQSLATFHAEKGRPLRAMVALAYSPTKIKTVLRNYIAHWRFSRHRYYFHSWGGVNDARALFDDIRQRRVPAPHCNLLIFSAGQIMPMICRGQEDAESRRRPISLEVTARQIIIPEHTGDDAWLAKDTPNRRALLMIAKSITRYELITASIPRYGVYTCYFP